jgi:hypothetical protein
MTCAREKLMGSFEGIVDRLNGPLTTCLGAALLVAAGALFVAAQISISTINGWFIDELFSLWASDTSLPFTRAFSERIAPDSNPPLYFAVLYWVRWLITDDRTAVFAVNIAAMVIAGGAIFVASRRAGLSRLAVGGLAACVLSGPVLYFASEGRSYCLGLAVVFVASWYAALAIEDPHRRSGLASFIALGAVAALTHVYAALLCGGLAAGLLTLALFSRRRDLVGPGLALGLSASVVFVIWLSIWLSLSSLGNLGRIEFSPGKVFEAAWFVKTLAVGRGPTVLLLIFLLVFGILDRATRPFFITFGIAFALFVLVPVIASLKQPIIFGRYWLVGAPALIPLVTFAGRTWFLAGGRPLERKMRLVAACSTLLFLGASSIYGFVAAHSQVAWKWIWRGAEIVQPFLDRCPTGMHIANGDVRRQRASFPWHFAKMTGASPSLFVDARLQSTPSISPAMTPCPVLGWAEQIWGEEGFMARATDADLVRYLKIEASLDEVDVRRHNAGFVVLKRVH